MNKIKVNKVKKKKKKKKNLTFTEILEWLLHYEFLLWKEFFFFFKINPRNYYDENY